MLLITTPLAAQKEKRICCEYSADTDYPYGCDMDFSIAHKAAQCRADYELKTADAIQLATAILEEADVLITSDLDFKKVDFPIIFLRD